MARERRLAELRRLAALGLSDSLAQLLVEADEACDRADKELALIREAGLLGTPKN